MPITLVQDVPKYHRSSILQTQGTLITSSEMLTLTPDRLDDGSHVLRGQILQIKDVNY